nr:coat protein 3 [Red clover-associated virus 1]
NSVNLSSVQGLSNMDAVVATGEWSTTTTSNLMELTVHPTAVYVKDGLVTQTSMSVLSCIFDRWRGSITYKFVFGASMFVRGKVVIAAVPVQFRDKKLSVNEIMCFNCVVCDLSEATREFVLEVPYISVAKNSIVCKDSLYDVSSFNSDMVVTRLHAIILDPLVMSANANNKIEYYVTMQPGKDFELIDLAGVKSESVDRTLSQ